MKYYLCIVGKFDGAGTIYDECVERGIYQYYCDTRQKGPVAAIESGDILVLVNEKHIKGYGIAVKSDADNEKGHDKEWCAIKVKDGWRLVDTPFPLPYGVYGNTIPGRGTKQSIVKELKPDWIIAILLQLKRMLKEDISEPAFPVRLSELAIGLKSSNPFFTIPKVQRGLVWNSTRCEVLWDSILRGFPIGAISVRPTKDYRWELFDGQQRTNAASLGYADWPTDKNMPILWIDISPVKLCGRRFVLMVTTPAHPWGYELSDDEKTDNRLKTWEQKEAVDRIGKAWENYSKRGARPYTRELWPVKAHMPMPFSLLRQYIESCPNDLKIEFHSFLEYCKRNFSKHNWMRFLSIKDASPQSWDEIVRAIRDLPKYVVIALNGDSVANDDLGLYFKRMNKQGMEPDDEEIQYSLLKSVLPCLKDLDVLAEENCTRPAWLANIAIRFWLSKNEGWKWHPNVSRNDIQYVESHKDGFANFIKNDMPSLLSKLYKILVKRNDGLLVWHLRELYKHGYGSDLALYLLKELTLKRPTDHFVALVTIILWFGNDISKCAKNLWTSGSIQDGLFHAIQCGAMARVFTIDEVRGWAERIKNKLEQSDWGDGDSFIFDPYIGQAIECIWKGFHGGTGCSFLLFACRKFMNDYFEGYNISSPEWREQNRPWDYDHILPQDWVGTNRVSGYSYVVRKFLWSVGNSAPLPFSLNRGKNANPPDNYPDRTMKSSNNLHIDVAMTNQFGLDRRNYDRLDRNKSASKNFIKTTLDRIVRMVADWYNACDVGQVVRFDNCNDIRREFFEGLKQTLDECIGEASIWFVNGDKQYPISKPLDWARPWLSCGVQGVVRQKDGTAIRCLLGVASDGNMVEVGIRRHPEENSIPGDEWWYANETGSTYTCDSIQTAKIDAVIARLKELRDECSYSHESL